MINSAAYPIQAIWFGIMLMVLSAFAWWIFSREPSGKAVIFACAATISFGAALIPFLYWVF